MSERAVRLDIPGLEWSAGAPEPFLLSTEQRTLFGFYASKRPGTNAEEVVRVAEFTKCASVRFGFPNDEVLSGHPLYSRGLTFYTAHEVVDSEWLEAVRAIERHHPQSRRPPFPTARHWILTFHDTTLEAIATDVAVLSDHTDRASAMAAMTAATMAD